MDDPSLDDILDLALERQSQAERISLVVERWASEWVMQVLIKTGMYPEVDQVERVVDRLKPLAKALVERLDNNCPPDKGPA